MFWRVGIAHVLLWIASLTLIMCGLGSLVLAGSRGAAISFLFAAIVLMPPVQSLIAEVRHRLAPAKAALYSSIILIPIGIGFLAVDGVATLDQQAKRLGFASAGNWARARDLNLPTPQALAVHDEAQRMAQRESYCRERQARPPLTCFEENHQRAAIAYVEGRLGAGELEAVVRDAMAQQRKAYLAADRQCADLLDRIDEDAVPVIMQNRTALIAVAAGAWARHFTRVELEELTRRAKPGVSYISSGDPRGLEQKLAVQSPIIEKELDSVLQTWARQLVISEPSWRVFLGGRTPLTACSAAN